MKEFLLQSQECFCNPVEGWNQRLLEDLINIVGSSHILFFWRYMQYTQFPVALKAPYLEP